MAPKNRMLMDPNYPLWTGLEVLYINDNGVVTCNLQCDDGEFLDTLGFRRATLAEFFTRYIEHLAAYHPYEYDQLKREIHGILTRNGPDVATGDEWPGMPEPCQPIGCDNGIHLPGCPYATVDSRQVDPLDLGRRFE
jgi:hypothetical protein